ncbi:flagellar basal body-associated FliL family protein [Alkalibacillus haloalkaliphilus]|uniref:flagellar basal body-associated FliL family protein n=1 Tax=Alkalibacillus haloalkaliphilus TaxID=94136 RepID=UPI002935A791|nr:flagellar basal body-associated FliL family protein [Alkalibacillus haloalkaliphilus]MDV2580608.1 flagellar basal body-associated FliL family protein [Alkalibacillus haloalkaliphilus]
MTKPIKIMLTTLISLTIIGIVAIILLIYVDFDERVDGERTISEMADSSFVTNEITTDLSDGSFVRIQFRVVTDNQSTSEQLQEGEDFIINDAIIQKLTVLEGEDFRTNLDLVREEVATALNDRLDEGEVTDIFITEKAVQ